MKPSVGALLAACALPAAEARALLAHCLQMSRERLIAHPEQVVAADEAAAFIAAADRRNNGAPLAYLLGEKEFYGRMFQVGPEVLVPRPETELLIDLALARLHSLSRPHVLDLGTGSGCIAVTVALENQRAQVTATDVSGAALAVARDNARRLQAALQFSVGDWYQAVAASAMFDLIVANPPYVAVGDDHLHALRFEPALALTDGSDGLTCLRAVISGAAAHLTPGGWLMVEHGHDQGDAVRGCFAQHGLLPVTKRDAAGHPRVTLAQR